MGIIVEAMIDASGELRLREPLTLPGPRRVLVEILDSGPLGTLPRDTTTSSTEEARVSSQWSPRYKPLKELGRGGMAVTYQAEDTHTGATVCIKQLYDYVNRRTLLQECRALARMAHPYVVRLVDFDTMSERPYLVVEYVAGTPLHAYMRQSGPLSEGLVREVAVRICRAVAYAHSQDVIHRDLKPSNIVIAAPEEELIPKVLDFGLAVVARRDERDAITAVGNVAGTPHYMAPEQFQGAELTRACDVYSLGQILWEMIMGRPAFVGSTPYEIFEKKMSSGKGLRLDDAQVSRIFSQLVTRCTLPNPDSRPSADEVIGELQGGVTVGATEGGARGWKRWWRLGR